MIRSIRTGLLLSATALALVAAPVVLNATPLSDLSAMAGGKGNGNGGGNGGGGGNSDHGSSDSSSGGGNGNGNNKSSSDDGDDSSSGGSSKGKSSSSKSSKKVASTDTTTATVKANGKTEKVKNLNAQLAGLNSLKRNINGVMNSSDPRMEQVRDYVVASAALETATANLEQANADLTTATEAYNTYAASFGLTTYEDGAAYTDLSLTALQERAQVLTDAVAADPANTAAQDELDALNAAITEITISPELAAVTTAEDAVAQYQTEVADLEAQTTEEALRAALLEAANDNRVAEAGGDAYLTPEIMAWATAQIDGLVADYSAQQDPVAP